MRQLQVELGPDHLRELVEEVEAGETLTLLRGGRPVAQIIPFHLPARAPGNELDREAALERLRAISEPGFDLGIKWNGRDELYDRD